MKGLSAIKNRLRSCPDTEPEQAFIRLIIVIPSVVYLLSIDAFQAIRQ